MSEPLSQQEVDALTVQLFCYVSHMPTQEGVCPTTLTEQEVNLFHHQRALNRTRKWLEMQADRVEGSYEEDR